MEGSTNGNEMMEIEEIEVVDGGAPLLTPVDVKSGEEKYTVAWQENAKLLRFDEGENRWKERGQGIAKILRRNNDAGLFMFVFRREGVGKLAAQHYLLKGMEVKVHPKSEKSLLWKAFKDYTDDDEGYPESFVMHFTSKELADKALEAFNKAFAEASV